jgi:urease accessory protein
VGIIMSDKQCRFPPLALLRLQSWLSPAFPIGSYSYSHGLEWPVKQTYTYMTAKVLSIG